MNEFQLPEMQRCDLAAAVLQLKALGIHNVVRFDFSSPPPPRRRIFSKRSNVSTHCERWTNALSSPLISAWKWLNCLSIRRTPARCLSQPNTVARRKSCESSPRCRSNTSFSIRRTNATERINYTPSSPVKRAIWSPCWTSSKLPNNNRHHNSSATSRKPSLSIHHRSPRV